MSALRCLQSLEKPQYGSINSCWKAYVRLKRYKHFVLFIASKILHLVQWLPMQCMFVHGDRFYYGVVDSISGDGYDNGGHCVCNILSSELYIIVVQ